MNIIALISLTIITLLILILFLFIDNLKKQGQIKIAFSCILICLLICCTGLMLQITFTSLYHISPIYFDYFVYVGNCFLPVALFFVSLIFYKTKITVSKRYLLLFVIPVISILTLWTNDFHHLFYKLYSTNINETIYGPYFSIHTTYTLLLYAISLFNLIRFSIKNSGFFSKQAILMLIGSAVPIITNILGLLGIITMDIYFTPITFAIAILFISFAIFKFDFLKVAPIALQKVVDRMSDAYIVINEENKITDFNKTFIDIFKLDTNNVRNKNIFDLINKNNLDSNLKNLSDSIENSRKRDSTIVMEEHFISIDKYFHIEINSIVDNGNFLGTLILFKDVTQHNIDMQTIKDNQDMLIEKERLASLGQMIGGIAHNLKTPIMSISGAIEGISDLVKEYDSSIGDPEVTNDDHHEIAHDMNEWISKIRTHLSYMSDIITAIKGQAVAFSSQDASDFTIDELVKYTNILMRHELKNSLINLIVHSNVDEDVRIKGNINSLVQVINNIISNAIQAYQAHSQTNVDIILNIDIKNDKLIIAVQDFAGGLPDKVKDKLFKEMITTKGKNGSGLGLFMSYSNIRAHFNGKISFETESGKGTTFYIEIPT